MAKAKLTVISSTAQTTPPPRPTEQLVTLTYGQPNTVVLRDGEVVLYRRPNSPWWQCRFKLQDGKWQRESTRHAALEHAVAAACLRYDEARFRQKLGLAQKGCSFAELAHTTITELRDEMAAGRGKSVYASYITCIERYILPYFKEQFLEQITHTEIIQFEGWRNRQMQKVPRASTLNNFASAWNRLIQTAINRGWVSERAVIPRLNTRGIKSRARPAFLKEEIDRLLSFMESWQTQGRFAVEHEIRPLLRDYVEMLLLTGMRHGTEALGLCWHHVEWHWDKGQRYLRLWVNGKTGPRWLIAKHRAVDVLQRLHLRQVDIAGIEFEELLRSRTQHQVFRFSTGYQPPSLNGTFRRLMRDSGLMKSTDGQNRTLYSLRHTYATMALIEGMDIHTLAKQMGNSAAMIERHYSKLTATMAADRLA